MTFLKRNPNTKAFWEKKYSNYIELNELRSDGDRLLRFNKLFQSAGSIMDFGAGLGGNVEKISGMVNNTRFVLVDHSETSLNYARERLLGTSDKRGNSFEYQLDLNVINDASMEMITSLEVLEHITEYGAILDLLWKKLKPGGILLISVPVKGIRDRTRQHVNKFTVNSMFRILARYGEIVHISPRTYSKRSGRLSTAYFYIQKPET